MYSHQTSHISMFFECIDHILIFNLKYFIFWLHLTFMFLIPIFTFFSLNYDGMNYNTIPVAINLLASILNMNELAIGTFCLLG